MQDLGFKRVRPISMNGEVVILAETRSNETFMPVAPLVKFARQVLSTSMLQLKAPVEGAIHTYGSINGVVIHRDGNFQAELFVINGNIEIPSHGHPDIDSIELYVSGDVDLLVEGKSVMPEGDKHGFMVRVFPNQEHSAHVGPDGGCFMSIQHWINGIPPSSVGLNWSGDPHEQEQKERYRNGK
jgi:cytoskeletal protein CcmA (bactofilin family)